MYITLNNEQIVFNFNPYPHIRVSGPDSLYYVELREYKKNEDQSLYVEGYKISSGFVPRWRVDFTCPIEFYGDFEIQISKYISGYGLSKIFVHRFNDYGKSVLFNLITKDIEEARIWVDRIKLYQKIHGCRISINSDFEEINKSFESYYHTNGIDFYKTYNIGRFPKTSSDFRTMDHRKEGLIWYGNWKTFWSYQHPRKWTDLTSQEIVDDILGL